MDHVYLVEHFHIDLDYDTGEIFRSLDDAKAYIFSTMEEKIKEYNESGDNVKIEVLHDGDYVSIVTEHGDVLESMNIVQKELK